MLLGYDRDVDALRIEEGPDFQARLLDFLNSPIPLRACSNCLGTVGRTFPHRLTPRAEWSKSLDRPVAELLDPEFKQQLCPTSEVAGPLREN